MEFGDTGSSFIFLALTIRWPASYSHVFSRCSCPNVTIAKGPSSNTGGAFLVVVGSSRVGEMLVVEYCQQKGHRPELCASTAASHWVEALRDGELMEMDGRSSEVGGLHFREVGFEMVEQAW